MIQKPKVLKKMPIEPSQQVTELKQHNMTFNDENEAEIFFKRVNYFRFCQYANSLAKNQNDFSDVTFEKALDFYDIDREFRSVLMTALAWVEVSFRTAFAYTVSSKTSDPFFYVDSSNFVNPSFHTQTMLEIEKDFKNARINVIGTDKTGSPIYEAPPAWGMVEIVSFGKISKLFCNLAKIDWIERVGKQFGFKKNEIKSVVKSLVELRNQCAHHRKILFSNFNSTPAFSADMKALKIDNTKIGGFIYCIHKMMKPDPKMQSWFLSSIKTLYEKSSREIKSNFGAGTFF